MKSRDGKEQERKAAPTGKRRWKRWVLGVLLGVVVLIVGGRLALPSIVFYYVNSTLDSLPDYGGHVGSIDIHLWRGDYTLHDVEIVKTAGAVPVPFFSAKQIDFTVQWKALRRGRIRATVVIDTPRLNFVAGSDETTSQTGASQPWLSVITDLSPFRIDEARIHHGEIHFEAFHVKPQVDIYLTEIEAELKNLTNIEHKSDPLLATLSASGTAMESADFQFNMQLDPNAYAPTFQLAARLLHLDVTQLNDLSRAYGRFDFQRGQFDLVVEVAAKDGVMDGYAKPLFRNLQVFSLKEDPKKDDPLTLFWEAIVGVVVDVFKNQSRDQLATKIPLRGKLDSPHTDVLATVGNVLVNAFVRAFLPNVEGRVAPDAAHPEESK